ncbi:MAG: hypothetical protein ACW96X_05005, partial [Promethearchaeota archaeon]
MQKIKNCNYCGWTFPAGFLQNISENDDSVFCENCGTELLSENPISNSIKSEEESNQDLSKKKNNKMKRIFNEIYESIRNRKSPIARVLLDSDFTKIFKDSFKIVISRIIYSHLRAWQLESAIDIKTVGLNKEVLDKFYKKISPVLTMRIKREYLGNLHKINTKNFEKWLKKLQTKLKLNKRYHQDFIIYLRWLINEVYIIVFDLWNNPDIPKFERIIRDDLKKFYSTMNFTSYSQAQNIQKNDENFYFPIQPLEKGKITEKEKKNLIEFNSNIQGGKIIFTELGEEKIVKKLELNRTLEPPTDDLEFANKWFTDSLKSTMLNYDFLRKHASIRRMSSFFGLSKSYLYDIRYKKTIISHEYLDQMKSNLYEMVKRMKKVKNLNAIEALNILFGIIEIYRQKYNPKITASTQIDKDLKQNYFSQITSIEQAFFLGLMFADGWLTIQRSKNRESYRMGLALKIEDREMVEQFAIAIGLPTNRVQTRDVIDSKTGRRYKMAYLYIGVGSTSVKRTMGNDLIKLGMVYKINKRTGRRYKVPILPI